MVGAISTFVNDGFFIKPMIITRIEDKNGAVIYEAMPEIEQVFDANLSATMVKMMQGVVDGVTDPYKKKTNGTSMRLRSGRAYGKLRNPIGGKTGTTQSNSDGWFIGITPELVSGVWTGGENPGVRFRNTGLGQGATMALPIFGYYMNKVYADESIDISKGKFVIPDNYVDDYTNCNNQPTTEQPDIDYDNFANSGID